MDVVSHPLVMPVIAFLLGRLFFARDFYTQLGFLIGATVPVGVTSIIWTSVTGGNTALALATVTLDTILTPQLALYGDSAQYCGYVFDQLHERWLPAFRSFKWWPHFLTNAARVAPEVRWDFGVHWFFGIAQARVGYQDSCSLQCGHAQPQFCAGACHFLSSSSFGCAFDPAHAVSTTFGSICESPHGEKHSKWSGTIFFVLTTISL